MSWRYQKRIRVLPGVHLNLSRSGVGVSIGDRGAHVGWTARGRRYVSWGLPGTGLSWREYERRRPGGRASKVQPMVRPVPCELCQPGHAHVDAWVFAVVIVMALMVAIAMGTGAR
jgi:hypothetical protein